MIKNPITSFFGLIAVLCPIVSSFFPELKPICDSLTMEAVGLGLISAADGVRRPATSTAGWFLPLMGVLTFSVTIAACSWIPSQRTINAAIAEHGAGQYQVTITKDGKTLWSQTVTCTSNESELTGCHAAP